MPAAAAVVLVGACLAGCDSAGPAAGPAATGAPPTVAATAPNTARAQPTAPAWSEPTGPQAAGAEKTRAAAQYLDDPRYAGADLGRGKLLSLACAACHTFHAGQDTIVGPNLHGVFGRAAGSVPGFDYSAALRSAGIVWTPDTLERWLADPASFVDGTKMGFTGYRSADDRRDLIAYLLHATEDE